ncbi:fatty acyl-AMP ligase [Nocardiopsis trehalosi]|uniref:fatty acyl-AMP ligase n=1 Tax=Nocardiopsis trehalosi TaxID=109329 RepID=UPI00082CF708|nr:fatty acyl-AMP ligase [Nocardiopsis trehalosi]
MPWTRDDRTPHRARGPHPGPGPHPRFGPAAPAEPLIARLDRWAAEAPHAPAYAFTDHTHGAEGATTALTWSETARRAAALAARVHAATVPGERVAILAPQGIDYVVAVLAVLRTHAAAVPLPAPGPTRPAPTAPGPPGRGDRLAGALRDCAPALVLTTSAAHDAVKRLLADAPGAAVRAVAAVDEPAPAGPPPALPDPPAATGTAYLQYTSGATRRPAGVVVTHANLTANVRQVWAAAVGGEDTTITTAGWLPLFHGMGLLLTVAVPLLTGSRAEFMDPAAFAADPIRWLRLMSRRRAVYSAAPDSAYAHCARRVRPADRAGLDLSGVRRLLNGGEPVRPATLRAFTGAFAGAGLDPAALTPAYGLAEATACVGMDAAPRPPRLRVVDRDALAAGVVVERPDGEEHSTVLVSCGRPVGQRTAVVDPHHRVEVPEGAVGEIWVSGPNVGGGYRGGRGAEAFGAVLRGGDPDVRWLRTGDLGALVDGELHVTGRAADRITADGRHHDPRDIEATVAAAHPRLRGRRVAAYGVPADLGGHLVVTAEAADPPPDTPPDTPDGDAALTRTVRAAVFREHALRLHDLVLVGPGAIPRTALGTTARSACRDAYLRDRRRAP